MYKKIVVPFARMSNRDDSEAARRRRELREKLLQGEQVRVKPDGSVRSNNERPSGNDLVIPPGKLANFYWYEKDKELLKMEKQAMAKHFPDFQLEKFNDGRLCWTGKVITNLRPSGSWHLQVIYENNHPDASTYGGSIKVYSIHPDLANVERELGFIPHTLKDSQQEIYICSSRQEDVRTKAQGNRGITTAASAMAWAVKWISGFELWMAGDLSTAEFSSHRI